MDSEGFSRIRGYLAEQLEVDPEKITPDSDIVNDFGADSLDVIDMITVLSDEFCVIYCTHFTPPFLKILLLFFLRNYAV